MPASSDQNHNDDLWWAYDHGVWRLAVLLDKDGDCGYFRCITSGVYFVAWRDYCRRA